MPEWLAIAPFQSDEICPSKSKSTVQLAYAVLVVLRTVTSPLKPLPQSLVTESVTAVDGVAVREGVGAATSAGAASVTVGDSSAAETGAGAGVGTGSSLAIVTVPLRSAIVACFGDERLIVNVSFGS